jgi:hypothetical protein
MSKHVLKLETVEQSIEQLNTVAKTNDEREVIENVKQKIISLLNDENEIIFIDKDQIHEFICDEIDEEIKKHAELSKDFLDKLENIRINQYLSIVFLDKKRVFN